MKYEEVTLPRAQYIKDRIEKINLMFTKKNLPHVTVTYGDPYVITKRKQVYAAIIEEEVTVLDIELTTPPVVSYGWDFAGVITDIGSSSNLVSSNGIDIPSRFSKSDPTLCEHCNVDRKRKEVFIVRDALDNWKQVGRDCLADYLGHDVGRNITSIAYYFGQLSMIENEFADEELCYNGGDSDFLPYTVEEYVAIAASCIRANGFLSVTKAKEGQGSATVAEVGTYISSPKHAKFNKPSEEDIAQAAEAVKWGKALPADSSDYETNLMLACEQSLGVHKRTTGILCSLITAMLREKEEAVRGTLRAEKNKTRIHVGTVGERLIFHLTLLWARSYETQYGTYNVCGFSDADGNVIMYKGNCDLECWEKGDEITLKATVKEHDEYEGCKQTIIARPSVQVEKGELI